MAKKVSKKTQSLDENGAADYLHRMWRTLRTKMDLPQFDVLDMTYDELPAEEREFFRNLTDLVARVTVVKQDTQQGVRVQPRRATSTTPIIPKGTHVVSRPKTGFGNNK